MIKSIISLLICLLVGVSSIAQSKTVDTKDWHFKVYLDDSLIGYHYYNLERNGAVSQISIKAEFDVKFLFISVYDYQHENTEVWNGPCLSSLSSKTDDNGEKVFVNLSSENNRQIIETSQGVVTSEQCLRSFAYWNPDLLQSDRLINAQTGEVLDIEFSLIGDETIMINQQSTNAERYRIKGEKIEIDVWYSPNKEWLALQSITEGGYVLRYEREQKDLQ